MHAERLGDEVLGAGLEDAVHIGIGRARGKEQQARRGGGRRRAEPGHLGGRIRAGRHDVHQQEFGRAVGEGPVQLGYIGDGNHLEAVLPQDADERPPEGEIGIEDDEPRCGHPAMNLANTASSTLPPEAITATGPFGR